MTDYYVSITKEQLEDLDAVCIRLNTGGRDTLCIVSNEQYNQLVDELNDIRTNTQDYILGEINDVMTRLTQGAYPIPYSDRAGKLGDSNSENYLTYQDIAEYMNKPDNEKVPTISLNLSNLQTDVNNIKNNLIQTKINSALTGYYAKSIVDGKLADKEDVVNKITSWNSTSSDVNYPSEKLVKTALNGKSDTTHKHTGWKKYTFSNATVNNRTTFYYNDDIRMASFRYYLNSYKFTKTDAFVLHTGIIPSGYRPNADVVLPFYHYHLIGYIDNSTGSFYIKSDAGSKSAPKEYAINTSAMWKY